MAYAPLGQGNRNEMFGGLAVRTLAEKYGKTPAQILSDLNKRLYIRSYENQFSTT